nr:hypothetical protein OH820_20670 [Streptomyces sp. NBC_00857]
METLHTADEVRYTWDRASDASVSHASATGPAPIEGGAVVVSGDRIGAVGTYDELRARFPRARVRKWAGTLGPALVHDGPLPEAPSPRERIHAVLKLGAVAVLERYVTDPGLHSAAERVGVMVLPAARRPAIADMGRADLAVFDADGRCVATVCAGRLVHRRA